MRNRGVSNIEMVISFLLFVGFIFGALLLINPGSSNDRLTDSSLSYATSAILQNVSVELISYSVKITIPSEPPVNTFAIDFPPENMLIPLNYNVYAETYSGVPIKAERNGQRIYLDVSSLPVGVTFVIVKFSEDFDRVQLNGHPEPILNSYEVASSSARNLVSEKRVKLMNESYYTNYNSLKKALGLPESVEFGFGLNYRDGYSIILRKSIPTGVNVFSTANTRETITNRSANYLVYGEVSAQVW
jgi:hypothetical protein